MASRNAKNKYWYVLLLLLVLLFSKNLLTLFLTISFIVASVAIGLYRYIIPFNLGLELITFTTIILCFGVSPVYAWLVAIVIIVLTHILTANICVFMLVKIAVYGLVCLIAFFLAGMDIQAVGIILVVLKNIIFLGITFWFNSGRAVMDLPSNVINVAFNMFLFQMWSAPLLSVFGR